MVCVLAVATVLIIRVSVWILTDNVLLKFFCSLLR